MGFTRLGTVRVKGSSGGSMSYDIFANHHACMGILKINEMT